MDETNWTTDFSTPPRIPYYHDLCGGRLWLVRTLAGNKLVGFYCPTPTCDLWIMNGHILPHYRIVGGTEGLRQ